MPRRLSVPAWSNSRRPSAGWSSGWQPWRRMVEFLALRTEDDSEQLGQRPAFFKELEGPPLAVGGVQVVDAHRLKDRPGNLLGGDRIVGGILGAAIAGAEHPTPAHTPPAPQHPPPPGPPIPAPTPPP